MSIKVYEFSNSNFKARIGTETSKKCYIGHDNRGNGSCFSTKGDLLSLYLILSFFCFVWDFGLWAEALSRNRSLAFHSHRYCFVLYSSSQSFTKKGPIIYILGCSTPTTLPKIYATSCSSCQRWCSSLLWHMSSSE